MIVYLLVTAAAFLIGAQILPGVEIKNIWQSIVVAIVVAILDLTLGTFLKIITLGILSLGIFNWLLNAILIQVADWFLSGFKVNNFWWALGLAAVVSIASGILKGVFNLG